MENSTVLRESFLGIVDGISKTQKLELYDSVGDNFALILNEESQARI
jgi:hypothetical protein